MKESKNIKRYKEKIIELADKLQEKEKECSYLKELSKVHENRIINLEKQLDDDKRHKGLMDHIEQQDNKITSLIKERDNYKDSVESLDKFVTEKQLEINSLHRRLSEVADTCIQAEKQRDNWKADCEYNEQCFQAEREARYRLEDEIKVLKGQKTYPCLSLNCNDITGESSSLYFCFSYNERLLLADNVPKYISTDQFIVVHTSTDHNTCNYAKTYHVVYASPLFQGTSKPYDMARAEFDIAVDLKAITRSIIPTSWLSVNKNKKYSLANYELNYYGVENDKYKVFYLRDKHTGRTVPFTNLVKTNSKLSEYQLIDTFMESLDILQIQHFDGQNFTNFYIDLITFTPHQTMFSILDRRNMEK